MKLDPAYLALAIRLQEAAELSSNDVTNRLRDAISDHYRGTGTWGYLMDYFGDAESGDVIYSCDSDTMRASYEISDTGGAAKCVIDFEGAEDVVPRTIYEPEMDEEAHYAAMEESLKREGLYGNLPMYERFIAKSERDAADASDFAGKGKSFPILKPDDVMAAVHAMGRAGSGNLGPSGIKSRIISIAKRKGWTKYLPKSWRGDASESASPPISAGTVRLCESAAVFCDTLSLRESRVNYPIKLISPGTGTSAHYTAEMLQASAKKFKAGTLMFWNHPTAAEEAQRPEGSLDDLAAITTKAAYWSEGPKGPGLYAEAKVMADYATKVEERAPHIGLSIRAGGTTAGQLIEGKPVLKSIDYVESVDYVTKAGRGGLALAEAARDAGIEEKMEFTEAQIKQLVAQGVQEALCASGVSDLRGRALQQDARAYAVTVLEGITLPPASREFVIADIVNRDIPVTEAGAVDKAKLKEAIERAAKAQGEYLTALMGSGSRPVGLGAPAGTVQQIDPVEAERRAQLSEAADKRAFESDVAIFESLGMPKDAATFAAKGRAA